MDKEHRRRRGNRTGQNKRDAAELRGNCTVAFGHQGGRNKNGMVVAEQ